MGWGSWIRADDLSRGSEKQESSKTEFSQEVPTAKGDGRWDERESKKGNHSHFGNVSKEENSTPDFVEPCSPRDRYGQKGKSSKRKMGGQEQRIPDPRGKAVLTAKGDPSLLKTKDRF
jgi:hypothetical protein